MCGVRIVGFYDPCYMDSLYKLRILFIIIVIKDVKTI